jgi:hypothetical protein
MVQRRKERRGFAREEKRMMSIWHRVRWKKQEGHSKKNSFTYRIVHQQQQQHLLHIKALQDAFRDPVTVEEVAELGVNFSFFPSAICSILFVLISN